MCFQAFYLKVSTVWGLKVCTSVGFSFDPKLVGLQPIVIDYCQYIQHCLRPPPYPAEIFLVGNIRFSVTPLVDLSLKGLGGIHKWKQTIIGWMQL